MRTWAHQMTPSVEVILTVFWRSRIGEIERFPTISELFHLAFSVHRHISKNLLLVFVVFRDELALVVVRAVSEGFNLIGCVDTVSGRMGRKRSCVLG